VAATFFLLLFKLAIVINYPKGGCHLFLDTTLLNLPFFLRFIDKKSIKLHNESCILHE